MWKKLRKKQTLNSSITSTLLIIILISLFVLLSIIGTFLTVKQWDDVKQNASFSLRQTKLYINTEIDSYLDNSITLTTNPEFIKILKAVHPESTEKRLDVVTRISSFFDMIPIRSEMLSPSFTIYSDNPTLYNSKYMNDLGNIPNPEIIQSLREINPSQPLWQTENDSPFVFYMLIDASRKFTNVLRVQIDIRNINSFITNAETESYYLSLSADRQSKDIISSTELRNSSMLYSVIPVSVRNSIIFRNVLIFISIFVCLSAMFFVIIKFITNKITGDIYDFIDAISNDKLLINSESVAIHRYDEFEIIKNKVIELLTSISHLHNKLEAAEKKKQEIELEVMQSKFNPHLLYNTLSAIKWNLMRGTTDKLSPLIDLLTKYYRNVLNQNSIITLAEEIQLIRQFVNIMSFAHSEQYNLKLNIAPELEDFKIMKHTLQPLVENAILHGINRKKDGIITISAEHGDGTVTIKIHDNGYGITAEKIAELDFDNYNSIYKNYGIRNTKNRLVLFFGKDNFKFIINSKPQVYTEIELVIITKGEV